MSATPESVRELLSSENLGDRLRGVNQIRNLEPVIGFELIQSVVSDKNSRVRYSAISQLDTLGTQDLNISLNILRDRLVNDPEPDVQSAAADCLAALKLTDAYEDLEHMYYNHPEWLVKFSIVAALGELGDSRAFELLQHALESENELVQTAAIGSLGELGDKKAISLLLPYASNPDWQVRYRVVQALYNLGGDEAKAALEKLTHDEVETVAETAKSYLN